jgi:ribosome biogenesis GTPase
MKNQRVRGLIIRVTGSEVWVEVHGRLLPCRLRGRLRKKDRSIQVVAGDMVEVAPPAAEGAPGTIEDLLPRRSWLSRYAGGREGAERIIVANVDTLFVVASVASPPVHHGFVDRVLVSAERGHIDARICINKIDLVSDATEIETLAGIYSHIGYEVVRTSAVTGEGVDGVRGLLVGGIYAFVGQSGVGKSSILKVIDPKLDLKIAGVTEKTGRGKHTTTFSQLFPISGGYMADTPGMQTFAFPGTEKEGLSDCFREMRERAPDCRFQPCTHSHEPGCAVKEAHVKGAIAETRFKSYLDMLAEMELREKNRYV